MCIVKSFLVFVLLVAGALTPVCAQTHENTVDSFKSAVSLMESGDFKRAVPILEALSIDHSTPNLLWNLGIATAEMGDHEKAKQAWLAYRELEPQDWRAYAKLIQSYQALGDTESRDSERKALIELWRSGKNIELSAEPRYCREQFKHNGKRVFAFEYFAPNGDKMVKYSFVVDSENNKDGFRISLGSYEFTNKIAWELGEIPKEIRLYHLDLYQGNRHETHGFYKGEPDYDLVRSDVASVLAKKAKPVSASVISNKR